jgi:hypothetical protein
VSEPRCTKCDRTPADGATFARNPLSLTGHFKQCDECRDYQRRKRAGLTPKRVVGDSKACSKCGRVYPTSNEFFAVCGHTQDGLQSWCRECKRVAHRAWLARQKASDPEGFKERQRVWNRRYYARRDGEAA